VDEYRCMIRGNAIKTGHGRGGWVVYSVALDAFGLLSVFSDGVGDFFFSVLFFLFFFPRFDETDGFARE